MSASTAATAQPTAAGTTHRSLRVPVPLFLCVVALLWGAFLALETRAPTTMGTDYFYYFCVSHMVAWGHGHDMYTLAALGHVERNLAAPIRVPHGVIPNVYPPFFAVALAPLARLPYAIGYVLWLALNCVCLAWTLWQFDQMVALGRRQRAAALVLALLFLPVIVALLNGQVSLILLALLTGTYLALRSGADTRAGMLLGLTLIKPQFAVPFLLVLLISRRWRAVAAFGATAAILTVTPSLVLGPGVVGAYVRTLMQATTWGAHVGGFQPAVNRSFAGFVALLLPHNPALVVGALLDLVALGTLAWVSVREREIDLPFALAVVVALAASQHVLIHDLSLLLLAFAIVARRRAASRTAATWLAMVYLLVYAGFFFARHVPIQVPTLGDCLLLVYLVRLHVVEPRHGHAAAWSPQTASPAP